MSRRFRKRWTAPEAGDMAVGGGEDDRWARERRATMAAIARSLEKAFQGHGFALLVFGKTPLDGGVSHVSNRPRVRVGVDAACSAMSAADPLRRPGRSQGDAR